jgi:phosphate/sulfate permease
MRTISSRIAQLEPAGGVATETAAAVTLAATATSGFAVSSTQVMGVALVGSGAAFRLSPPRWGVTLHAVVAWVITPVATALLASLAYTVLGLYT